MGTLNWKESSKSYRVYTYYETLLNYKSVDYSLIF